MNLISEVEISIDRVNTDIFNYVSNHCCPTVS